MAKGAGRGGESFSSRLQLHPDEPRHDAGRRRPGWRRRWWGRGRRRWRWGRWWRRRRRWWWRWRWRWRWRRRRRRRWRWRRRRRRGRRKRKVEPQDLAGPRARALVRDVDPVRAEEDRAGRLEPGDHRRLRPVRLHPEELAGPGQARIVRDLQDVQVAVRPPRNVDDEAESRPVGLRVLPGNDAVDARDVREERAAGQLADVERAVGPDRDRGRHGIGCPPLRSRREDRDCRDVAVRGHPQEVVAAGVGDDRGRPARARRPYGLLSGTGLWSGLCSAS